VCSLLDNIRWEVVDVKPTFTDTTDNSPFQAILLRQRVAQTSGRLPPLVVMIHGGPHSGYATYFHAPLYAYLVSLGFVVVAPNYRGSIVSRVPCAQ